ncbi:MAG: hypothetical protein RL172_1538 [Bacteroidota bacterium]|jgi:copper homeostasis protein
MSYLLEIIGFTVASCRVAEAAGANRIELCDNPYDGGTTASKGFIMAARKATSLPLYAIIRPRGGDFLYSAEEFESMQNDVLLCKQLGCDGVVIGMLLPDGSIDVKRCSRLVQLAYPMGVTFHRAFDRCSNPLQSLETIIELGCERILTSGQHPTAAEGAALIQALVQQAGNRISIMPGSGVNSSNIVALAKQTGATEFHASARTLLASAMQYQPGSMQEQLQTIATDPTEIAAMRRLLNQL